MEVKNCVPYLLYFIPLGNTKKLLFNHSRDDLLKKLFEKQDSLKDINNTAINEAWIFRYPWLLGYTQCTVVKFQGWY